MKRKLILLAFTLILSISGLKAQRCSHIGYHGGYRYTYSIYRPYYGHFYVRPYYSHRIWINGYWTYNSIGVLIWIPAHWQIIW